MSYNGLVDDVASIICWICAGPGHHMKVCPLHLELLRRYEHDGFHRTIYLRAVAKITEGKK